MCGVGRLRVEVIQEDGRGGVEEQDSVRLW